MLGCDSSYYQIGPAHSGPVYMQSGTNCVTVNLTIPTYQRGAPIPASTFAAGTFGH